MVEMMPFLTMPLLRPLPTPTLYQPFVPPPMFYSPNHSPDIHVTKNSLYSCFKIAPTPSEWSWPPPLRCRHHLGLTGSTSLPEVSPSGFLLGFSLPPYRVTHPPNPDVLPWEFPAFSFPTSPVLYPVCFSPGEPFFVHPWLEKPLLGVHVSDMCPFLAPVPNFMYCFTFW